MSDTVSEAIALRRSESLTAIVQKELERLIVTGELRAGDRLNEQALAQRFGVSRGPVREAMRALECAQLVSTRLNQGFFVREISPEETAEIYDVRAVVYGFICARLATQITEQALADLEDSIRQMDAAIAAGDPVGYYRLNLQFHEHTIVHAAHERAQQTYRSLINEGHLARQRSLIEPERMRQSNREHKDLVAALRAGDSELARRLGEEHSLAGYRRWKAAVTGDGQDSSQNPDENSTGNKLASE
ncbi:MAG TPA: GntR family transcriptional regulator [Rhodospirillaceae bacterium]|nr:GntR family transcriptional regulator [Magnetovibrio sp.]HCS68928.1 GntR family transcriptional regulator [Rhodospirillaceae bacterium]|tara:strand:+ start:12395 stop:13132 length:738 start_codon:yes stop_codon:yes gene_type:complete